MSDKSAIEWTDATWNPIRARNLKTGKVGWYCEHATTGCEFCYAEGFNKRLGAGLAFKPGHRKDVEIFLDEKMLRQPLHWKKPRMIFVCSMSDLFADFVDDAWLYEIFAVMGACDGQGLGHTFQILTKRPARMLEWVRTRGHKAWNSCRFATEAWPARNVWLGVSTERQQEADERIPLLLQTPAAVRFISAEPLLGPIDLTEWLRDGHPTQEQIDGPRGMHYLRHGTPRLGWVICGGESGPGYRTMLDDWAWDILKACSIAGVPFFMKQMAGKKPIPAELFVREMPRTSRP